MAAPKTKIFVGHLPDNCKNEDLQALFAKYGTVKECDVINKYGFVHMSTPEEADEAIKNLNNFNWMGSCISVEPSKSKLHPEPGAPGRAKTNFTRGGLQRNGFGPRSGFDGTFSNGYRPAPPPLAPPPFGGEGYYDRSFPYGRDRMRPYPSPYERRSPGMPPMREDYVRRPIPPPPPPPPGTTEVYGRPIPSLVRDTFYERRPAVERSEYLYSRRSPPSAMVHSAAYQFKQFRFASPISNQWTGAQNEPYWYPEAHPIESNRNLVTATRHPAYY